MQQFPEIKKSIPVSVKLPECEEPWGSGSYGLWWALFFLGWFFGSMISMGARGGTDGMPANPTLGGLITWVTFAISLTGHIVGWLNDKKARSQWEPVRKHLAALKQGADATLVKDWRPHGQIIERDGTTKIVYRNGDAVDMLEVPSVNVRRVPGPTLALRINGTYEANSRWRPTAFLLSNLSVTLMDPSLAPDVPTFGAEASTALQLEVGSLSGSAVVVDSLPQMLSELERLGAGSPGTPEIDRAVSLFTALAERASTDEVLSADLRGFIKELEELRQTMDTLAIRSAFARFRERITTVSAEVEIRSLR